MGDREGHQHLTSSLAIWGAETVPATQRTKDRPSVSSNLCKAEGLEGKGVRKGRPWPRGTWNNLEMEGGGEQTDTGLSFLPLGDMN